MNIFDCEIYFKYIYKFKYIIIIKSIDFFRGILYDPDVADACLKLFDEKRFEFD